MTETHPKNEPVAQTALRFDSLHRRHRSSEAPCAASGALEETGLTRRRRALRRRISGWLFDRPAAGAHGAAVTAGPGREQRRGPAVLTRRIIVINLLSLIVLIGGVLYLNQRSQNLIDAHRRALETQSRTIADVLAETAVLDNNGDPVLDREQVVPILRRLVDPDVTHAELYSDRGELIADSNLIQDVIITRSLAPPGNELSIWQPFRKLYDLFADFLAGTATYPGPGTGEVAARPAIEAGLRGEHYYAVRRDEDGKLIVSVAVPVQPLQKVLGVLVLEVSDIDEAIRAERANLLSIFAIAFIVSVISSLLLARTIARPIRRLAAAANSVRLVKARRLEIPDFTNRDDEIGELSASLRSMTAALYDRIEAIEKFAADVAHEIKNPLTSLRSAVETFELAKNEETRRKLLKVIKDDVSRIDRLISDISNASRLDAELARTKTEPVDMGVLLAALVDIYQATAREGDPKIDLDIDRFQLQAGGLVVSGQEPSLGQVFRNLIDNAKSFSPPGGRIEITVRRRETPHGSAVEIIVDDEGPGIPEDSLENIFERFYTSRPGVSEFGKHSGLGLSICRQIVRAHGGTIEARNRYRAAASDGEKGTVLGARFVVTLPVKGSS